MHDELEEHQERQFAGNSSNRAQRDADAHREERAGRRGVAQIGQHRVDRLRRAPLEIGGQHAGERRQDEGVQEDPPRDLQRQRPLGHRLPGGQGHHERHQREHQRAVEAEDQRRRHGRRGPECRQRQARPHIAHVRVSASRTLYRRSPATARERIAHEGRDHEHDARRGGRGDHEGPLLQLLERRLGDQLEEQRGKREVDDEGVEPGEPFRRVPDELPGDEAEQDQAEERRRKRYDLLQEGLRLKGFGRGWRNVGRRAAASPSPTSVAVQPMRKILSKKSRMA
ncbi:hypothetical protein N177_0806 [Lutibaculum baratangense AMV1]|uniref:Uncharacterized protein n=1 Tax=Lutibaculum baratangense AMV1 TaxID=631454 RepID=V4R3R0_9HYPH|nr:hypothetical protein N177_0806 [Lutibaculum baratangense AMV1]